MQHTLYRKHRPANFDEVFGQQQVVKNLTAFIASGKLPHAYLFVGSRGIGKTSVARIFANALNIKNEDIIEIDAASNRGIDDIRALRDSVYTMPMLSEYKIYIIDEVHMLTKDAFNALLKTLEEPPKHCLFILATTEREKVLDTIVSRCQLINFETPDNTVVANFVIDIAKKEGVKLEASIANMIAKNARGGFRDALTLLQQLIDTNTDGKIDEANVRLVLGVSSAEKVLKTLTHYATGEHAEVLKNLNEIKATTKPLVFLDSLIDLFRAAMIYRVTKGDTAMVKLEHIGITDEEVKKLVELAPEKFQSKNLIKFLETFEQSRHATYPWIYIESLLISE